MKLPGVGPACSQQAKEESVRAWGDAAPAPRGQRSGELTSLLGGPCRSDLDSRDICELLWARGSGPGALNHLHLQEPCNVGTVISHRFTHKETKP